MGEGPHSIVQKFFIMHMGIREKAWEIRILPGQRVETAEGRSRLADICVTSRDLPLEDIVHTPPLLCIEILGPEDGMSDMHEQVEEYLGMGVTMVWLVDPRRRRLYQTDGRSPQPVTELTVPGTEIWIGIDEVFEELDRLQRGVVRPEQGR